MFQNMRFSFFFHSLYHFSLFFSFMFLHFQFFQILEAWLASWPWRCGCSSPARSPGLQNLETIENAEKHMKKQRKVIQVMENVAKHIRISDPTKIFFGSDWAQKLGPRVSQPGDSENPLRSACFFNQLFFFSEFSLPPFSKLTLK